MVIENGHHNCIRAWLQMPDRDIRVLGHFYWPYLSLKTAARRFQGTII